MSYELDYRETARTLCEQRPDEYSLHPAPRPFVGEIRLLRRKDGGYMVAVLDYDDQAAELPDGSLAMEVVPGAAVRGPEAESRLAASLRRAQGWLNTLRLHSALEVVAQLRGKRREQELVRMLRDALGEAG